MNSSILVVKHPNCVLYGIISNAGVAPVPLWLEGADADPLVLIRNVELKNSMVECIGSRGVEIFVAGKDSKQTLIVGNDPITETPLPVIGG